MKKSILYLLLTVFAAVMFINSGLPNMAFALNKNNNLSEISISAKSAYLIDFASGEVIYEKNSNERLPIASMTKLATLSVVFDAINKSALKLEDDVIVSKNAASIKGSTAFLDAGSRYKVSDLIKTVIIASANDSAVALAEHISGSEEQFVRRMNKMFSEFGLKDTNFENSTGLPSENHYSSAQDMAVIYKTICDNEIYKMYSKIWMDELNHPSGRKTELVNTNRLIKTYDGIEGGKTGYTDAAKFCLTASARRGDMRLVGVVIGASDSKTRFSEMSKLFDYGFANFKIEEVINENIPATVVKFKSAKNEIDVYPEKSIVKFLRKDDNSKFSVDFELYEMKAPLKAGDAVGKMYVFNENNIAIDEINLVVRESVEAIDVSYSLKNILKVW